MSINETLAGWATNKQIVHRLVTLAMARPDYTEALYTVAASFGLRRTFAAELEQANGPIIVIEKPNRRRLEGGSNENQAKIQND